MNSIGTVLELMISRRIVIFREICITSRAGKAEWWPAWLVHLDSVLFVFWVCFARGFSLEAEARLKDVRLVWVDLTRGFSRESWAMSEGLAIGRWVMPEETANLRKSSNANRSPIHPHFIRLSRMRAGCCFGVFCFLSLCCVGWFDEGL